MISPITHLLNIADPEAMKSSVLKRLSLEPERTVIQKMTPPSLSFVAGMAAGVGIGLLVAPKPGVEMREDLRTKIKSAVDLFSFRTQTPDDPEASISSKAAPRTSDDTNHVQAM